jgi:hypothetical protein
MNKAVVSILLCLVLVFCQNCKKEEPEPLQIQDNITYCFNYNFPPSPMGPFKFYRKKNHYFFPHKLPNSNTLIYYRYMVDSLVSNTEIVSFDTQTKQEKVLLNSSSIFHYLRANKHGDIIYSNTSGVSGLLIDGRKQSISYTEAHNYPLWLPNRRYGFKKGNYFYISDINNVLIDSVEGLKDIIFRIGEANDDGKIIFVALNEKTVRTLIYKLDLSSKMLTTIKDNIHSYITDIRWHPNKETIYYADYSGLIRYNLKSKLEEVVFKNCDNKRIESFSFSSDSTLYVQCRNSYYKDVNVLDIEQAIYKMDINGKNIERIF